MVAVLCGLALPLAAQAEEPAAAPKAETPAAAPSNEDCLACHSSQQDREHGKPIAPVTEALSKSIHGQMDVACVDCHTDVSEVPHSEKLARVTCTKCHEDAVGAYNNSIHASARRNSADSPAAMCTDCHGSHAILGPKDPESPVYHFNLPATCGKCHADQKIIDKARIKVGNVPAMFHDSIHGQALEKSGLVVAPNCATCHGNHEIRRASDPQSRVNHANIPTTCGTCHQGIKAAYADSIHAEALKKGNPRAAVCVDCHTAHQTRHVDAAWKVSVVKECGTCHEQSIRSFRDSFHGKVTSLGFERAATCAQCHGSHRIFAKNDPRSAVAPGHIVNTCRQCHKDASVNLTKYDPHADAGNRTRNASLFFTSWAMKLLLIGVFSFFGIHTLLWFVRELQLRRRRASASTSAHE